jgi:hypothetical protein
MNFHNPCSVLGDNLVLGLERNGAVLEVFEEGLYDGV